MGFFTRASLEAVKSIPLYDIVSPVVKLSRVGSNWRGLSPFSNEKTPSFYVITDKNFYKCFSSGLAGDGIRFLQETEKLSFPEAVEVLAERFNIKLEFEGGGGPSPETRSLKREILEIHEYAADYYHQAFMTEHADAVEIRRYWTEDRGFTLETAKEYRIGMAPVEPRKLVPLLLEKGFSLAALKECGLFYPSRYAQDTPTSWKHRFRGRLMIPVCDLQGQVVAFTARKLVQTPTDDPAFEAKYINSPETPVFMKGQMLFNLNGARKAVDEAGRFLMVEGQLDAIRCASVGLKEAVAPQGTAVTEEQLRLLKRYADKLDVLLDGDRAGLQAVMRILPKAMHVGMEVRVLPLQEGEDPDDLLKARGIEAFEELEKRSMPGIVFAVKAMMPTEESPQAKAEALQGIFEIIAESESEVARDGYLDLAIATAGAPSHAVYKDFYRYLENKQRRPARTDLSVSTKPLTKNKNKLTSAVTDLLWIILQDAEWAYSLAQVIDQEWIRDLQTNESKLLARILDEIEAGNWEGVSQIDDLLESESERTLFADIYVEDRKQSDVEQMANASIKALAKAACKRAIETINLKIQDLYAKNPDTEQLQGLFNQKKELGAFLLNGTIPEIQLKEKEQSDKEADL